MSLSIALGSLLECVWWSFCGRTMQQVDTSQYLCQSTGVQVVCLRLSRAHKHARCDLAQLQQDIYFECSNLKSDGSIQQEGCLGWQQIPFRPRNALCKSLKVNRMSDPPLHRNQPGSRALVALPHIRHPPLTRQLHHQSALGMRPPAYNESIGSLGRPKGLLEMRPVTGCMQRGTQWPSSC